MDSSDRRPHLRIAALTLSATAAVLLGHGGAAGAAAAAGPALVRPATADTEAHERHCTATPTPEARHDRDEPARCAHSGHGSHHNGDRERSHAAGSHGSEGSSLHDQAPSPSDAGHLPGAETRVPSCTDTDSTGTNCSGESGVDRGTAHRASGVATGHTPAATPQPTYGPGGAKSSAGAPAPPRAEATTTRSLSAGVSAAAVPTSRSRAPAVPVTGTVAGIGAGLLLCLAGLLGLVLARRR